MPQQPPPLFNAVTSSPRQLLTLLRCLPPSSKAHVQLSPEGLRISTEDGSAMEAFVFLDRNMFTSYRYRNVDNTTNDAEDNSPVFQVSLNALIETLNIFTLSDMPAPKQSATTEAYAVHRLNRYGGINAFTSFAMSGVCTLIYEEEGSPLSIHMSEAGVATTCDLTTYTVSISEEIPFLRDSIMLKTIMRSSALLDAISELSALNPESITLTATPPTNTSAGVGLSATGSLGSADVDFEYNTSLEEPNLETLSCSGKASASFRFAFIRSAQRAMHTATKVSIRLDEEGVLSMQFLVELEANGQGSNVAFVDFKVVPLVEAEAEQSAGEDSDQE